MEGESFQRKDQVQQCAGTDEFKEQLLFHLGNTEDLVILSVHSQDAGVQSFIIYIDSLIDHVRLEEIIEWSGEMKWLTNDQLMSSKIKFYEGSLSFHQLTQKLLDGEAFVLTPEKSDWKIKGIAIPREIARTIEEPKNEQVIRGPHYGMNESLSSNIYLLRQRLKSPHLVVRYYQIGRESHTKSALIYVENAANQMIVEEFIRRIESIDVDTAHSVGYLEEMLEDHCLSPFPQFLVTERPDRVTDNLSEGRIAFMIDGSPTALIGPASFFSFYQSPDDYNGRFIIGTFYRLLRLTSFIVALLLPAFYIAIISFHFEVIPETLTLPAKRAIEDIPYPPLFEAFVMEITIELIREATVRLPFPVGQTIGVVGGLVIGDAVVNAGFVSNIMVIVVALTAISSFVVPSVEMNATVRILRFPFMILATLFGFYGVTVGLTILLIHLIRLESLGVPYLTPIAPFHKSGLRDSLFRMPSWLQSTRPAGTLTMNKVRQGFSKRWQHAKKQ
ncbi:spore germination protein [Jeotgalibacillus haloalkalitolerans]|uniref:Spore germination protein n=1 Tax=Jeotgalibacillus haloalkalitolerans TaxID=3104292 RepID=A0ABU5KIF5_9BACL|nr:spore germination protein [Jeotgalibacillus sp. HH7-29]MDZ5711008.1 spore germination protein [Jeotgalibacillus sp. HH7-29]